MLLKFWGVRGSIPAPLTSNQVRSKIIHALQEAARREIDLRDARAINEFVAGLSPYIQGTVGGNTSCISLETDTQLIIFDAGSGMRELGWALMEREFGRGQGQASIFFTHTHWDHIQGFPFFRPVFVRGNHFTIYSVHPYIQQVLSNQMNPEWFPVPFTYLSADIEFKSIKPGEVLRLGELQLRCQVLEHPGHAYAYRVEDGTSSVVLATDGEYKNLSASHTREYIDFFAGADILIFDAMFSVRESFIREDWGHSSAMIGADLARRAGVKRLLLFHHDPAATDDEIWRIAEATQEYLSQDGALVSPEVVVACEGMEIDLSNKADLQITSQLVGDVVVLHLKGRLDAYGADAFESQFEALSSQAEVHKIILDMRGLTELSTAGIKTLLDIRKQTYGMALAELPASIHRVLELAVTADFFAIYDRVDAALAALNAAESA